MRSPPPLQPAPKGAAPYDYRSTEQQRRNVRMMVRLLSDDLYDRSGSGETSAIWTSPLHWSVEYGHMLNGSTWARVLGPDGKIYAETTCADESWLQHALP
jgi:hypothetical protein